MEINDHYVNKDLNIRASIELSKRIAKIKRCIIAIETTKSVVYVSTGLKYNEFDKVIDSLLFEKIRFEYFVSKLIRMVHPNAVLPDRFYFSSYDIKSSVIPIIISTDNRNYQKLLSLRDGSIIDIADESAV